MYKKKYLQMKRGKEKSDKSVIAFFFCLFVLSYLLELLVLEGNQNTTHVKSRPQYVTSILTSSESITGTRAVFKSTLSSHSPFRVYVRTEREAGGAEAVLTFSLNFSLSAAIRAVRFSLLASIFWLSFSSDRKSTRLNSSHL